MKDTGRKGKAKFKVGQVVIPRPGMFGEGVPAKAILRRAGDYGGVHERL